MIHRINIFKDATLYEDSLLQNTGGDEILEVSKTSTVSTALINLNSRFLLQPDLTEVNNLISAGVIPGVGNRKFVLNLYNTFNAPIGDSFSIDLHAISGSWISGIGKRLTAVEDVKGVSWLNRDGYAGTTWETASFAANVDAFSDPSRPGGGVWFITPSSSYTFLNETTDAIIDITNIVENWLDNTWPNNGIIVKRTNTAESDTIEYGNLQFYSENTHTIYEPRVEVRWEDFSFNTGSLSELTASNIFAYLPELREEYKVNSKVNIKVAARERYPQRTFSATNKFLSTTYLSSSFYAIKDAYTEDYVIPFDDVYTRVSVDSNGNYFTIWTNSLEPERFYRFVLRVDSSNGEVEYFDNNFMFKVVR